MQELPDSLQAILIRFEAAVTEYAHRDNPMRAVDNEEALAEYLAAKEALIDALREVP